MINHLSLNSDLVDWYAVPSNPSQPTILSLHWIKSSIPPHCPIQPPSEHFSDRVNGGLHSFAALTLAVRDSQRQGCAHESSGGPAGLKRRFARNLGNCWSWCDSRAKPCESPTIFNKLKAQLTSLRSEIKWIPPILGSSYKFWVRPTFRMDVMTGLEPIIQWLASENKF